MAEAIDGKYQILKPLGEGGMGSVFVARHVLTQNLVALKLLHAALSRDDAAVERFKREVGFAARIGHDGIVRVHDAGIDRATGRFFIAMELLEGESLRERIARGGTMTLKAASFVRAMLEPLAAAHEAGIVHRDLKPQNVFLERGPDGERVKLLDLGIARDVRAQGGTPTASAIGTPEYMAPEQWKSARSVTAAADVWSVGVMLYEILTGRLPFAGDTAAQVMYAVLEHEPATPETVARIDPRLSALVVKCLAKDAPNRPVDARALARELDLLLADPSIAGQLSSSRLLTGPPRAGADAQDGTPGAVARTTERRSTWRRDLTIGLGVGLLTAVGAFGVTALRSPDDRPAPTRVAPAASPPARAPDNTWVRIEPPPGGQFALGVSGAAAATNASGFRPGRRAMTPPVAFEMQQHEVTWGELAGWLDADPRRAPGPWAPPPSQRQPREPATGIRWAVAREYCRSLGGMLPGEEQWEYAARGATRRPWPWGEQPLDPTRTRIYQGPDAHVGEVMTSDQDQTPGVAGEILYDLAGNAQEWTADLWREDTAGTDERWVREGGLAYRAVRGLPIAELEPSTVHPEGAAFRTPLCAEGPCPPDTARYARHVGFRCVRAARGAP